MLSAETNCCVSCDYSSDVWAASNPQWIACRQLQESMSGQNLKWSWSQMGRGRQMCSWCVGDGVRGPQKQIVYWHQCFRWHSVSQSFLSCQCCQCLWQLACIEGVSWLRVWRIPLEQRQRCWPLRSGWVSLAWLSFCPLRFSRSVW